MDQSAYGLHADTEERHWWFAARRRIVREVVSSLALPPRARLLEFGSGTGGNLTMLGQFGEVTALEPNDEARAIAAGRAPRASHVASLEELDGAGPFQAVLALDVIEHLDEPEEILRRLRRLLAPGAPLVVTVPAHSWLFGDHDRYLHHRRRYSRSLLAQHLTAGGFTVELLTPMNCALFPAAVLARLGEAVRSRVRSSAAAPAARGMTVPPAPLNRFLTELFAAERFVLGRGILPTGLSLLAVARG